MRTMTARLVVAVTPPPPVSRRNDRSWAILDSAWPKARAVSVVGSTFGYTTEKCSNRERSGNDANEFESTESIKSAQFTMDKLVMDCESSMDFINSVLNPGTRPSPWSVKVLSWGVVVSVVVVAVRNAGSNWFHIKSD